MIKDFFKEKTEDELIERGIKKLEATYKLKDLNEEEKRSFYYAQLNYPYKDLDKIKMDKTLLNITKNISKIMAREGEVAIDEVLIAQNFAIMGYLSALCDKLEKK